MSEKHPSKQHEVAPERHEGIAAKEQQLLSAEKARSAKHEHAEMIEAIREQAEHAASKGRDIEASIDRHAQADNDQPTIINNELKGMAYRRTMRRVQSQLNGPSRVFSKVVHIPAVESLSDIGSKTVARPSGVLAGGIVAFVGSSLFLWVARHYGYEYNFLLMALLFVGGFFCGLFLELLIRVGRRKRST